MKKTITALWLALSMLTAPFSLRSMAAESPFTVELQPIRVSAAATHILRVKFEKAISATDWLSIQWPEDSKMPDLPEDPSLRRVALEKLVETIYIGAFPCGSCHSPPTLDEKERTLTFSFPRSINPQDPDYTYTTIVIPDRAGFINPSKAGLYKMKIHTASHGTMESTHYTIVESKIGVPEGIPEVMADPSLPFSPAEYTISFNLGLGGALIANQSRIRIRFPKDTLFAQNQDSKHSYYIKINEVPLRASYSWNDHLLLLISPLSVANAGRVVIQISKELGIINPKKSGTYQLEVSSSEDTEWVKSMPYIISSDEIPLNIQPAKTERQAQLDLLVSLEKPWEFDQDHPLYLKFPTSFTLPEHIELETVEINGEKPNQVLIKDSIITLIPFSKFATHEPLIIKFLPETGIINPSKAGPVKLYLKTSADNLWIPTIAVNIQEARLMINKVHPVVWNACETSAYEILLELGAKGQLSEKDWISLIFPDSYQLPDTIDSSTVTINQRSAREVERIGLHEIRITLGISIDEYNLHLHFSETAGLMNPCDGMQDYHLWLETSQETQRIASPPFFIAPPLPKAKAEWSGGKHGENGWFIAPPVMELLSDSDTAELWFSWNHQSQEYYERYRGAQEMPDGFYQMTLFYFIRDAYGQSPIQQLELKVDTLKPHFEIIHPPYPMNYTNQNSIEISGKVEKQVLTDHGIEKEVYDAQLLAETREVKVNLNDGSFSFTVALNQPEESVFLILSDEAGWHFSKTIGFQLDQSLPLLNDIFPEPGSTSLFHTIFFEAKTKPNAEVWINQSSLWIGEEGLIRHPLQVRSAGKYDFNILIQDRFGNESSQILSYWFGLNIQMQIGNHSIENNGKAFVNDVPPLILHQSTYLPVRLMSEFFQAELEVKTHPLRGTVDEVIWKTPFHHIVMRVGHREARVNGQKVTMPVPPEIIQNRLMMPIRWMTEQMGGEVKWEADSRKVFIQYLEQETRP